MTSRTADKYLTRLMELPPNAPVLIAGPTASGKSALALDLAERTGGVVVNADAMQVYANWRVLTARPTPDDIGRVPHALYGHVGPLDVYSVGHWLQEVRTLLTGGQRPIIVGGTGLYFAALTEGLAEIPPIPEEVRAEADLRVQARGHRELLHEIDPATLARIDTANPARVQRAWEVLAATGIGLAEWQARTPAPVLARAACLALVIDAPPQWLNRRIDARFDAMLRKGALDEARANLDRWDARRPSARAIGGAELVAHLRGEMPLDEARRLAIVSTRQYAKRQRTWFRARMRDWALIDAGELDSGI